MKKILRKAILIACGWMLTLQAFADQGIKTMVKGSVQGTEVKSMLLYKRDSMRGFRIVDSIEADGQFQLAMNVKEPGFYVLTNNANNSEGIEMYLKPGDQITMKMEKNQIIMNGKGSKLNQFLFDLSKTLPYQGAVSGFTQTYNDRVKSINSSTNEEVLRNKALLLGNAQGEYLDKVFGRVVEYKMHGGTPDMMQVNFTDLNIRLVPEIIVYPNWLQTLTELMYAKVRAGQLKVRNINTWVADFGTAIENQKLREVFVLALLDYSAVMGDFRSINKEITEAFPLIKDPKNIAKVIGLKDKIAWNMKMFNYAPIGTDMSAYAFHNLNGKQVSVSDFKGKFIFIDIWNTGCKPCIAEMPFLKKLEQEMEAQGVVFLSISCDNNTDVWKKFLDKKNMTGEHLLIMNGFKDSFFEKMGRSGIPRFVILDKEGKVVDNNCCKRPSNPLLKIYLTELLKK